MRTPAPKAEASLLEHHRRLLMVSLGTAWFGVDAARRVL
jgi:hypothetical protein